MTCTRCRRPCLHEFLAWNQITRWNATGPRFERVSPGSQFSIRWTCHSWHRGIRRDFHLEGRGVTALWSAWPFGSVDRRGVTHSETRTGLAALLVRYEADFVGPIDRPEATVPMVFEER